MATQAANLSADRETYQKVTAIIGQAGVDQIFSPIDQPSGLPNTAYWSPEWLSLENERIFARNWVFVGAAGELPGAGTIKPFDVAGVPIVLVTGSDGVVRAFHNVCRHRGTRLVMESCKVASITCPYHAWNYRLDGRLRSRPHFHGADQMETFDGSEPSGFDLYPVRCETWNGCVFVDLSDQAPALLDWLAPMLNRTQAFDFSTLRWIAKKTYTIKSNWKLVLENYMEGYHVFATHPRLIDHAPMNVRWSGEWLDHVFYNDYVVPKLTQGRGDGLPRYPNLSDEDARRGMWFACMPNFAAEVYADQFVVLASYPVAPDETREELHFFVVGDEAATSDAYAKGRQELIAMWDDLNLEDKDILERLQLGRKSPAFEGSVMSPAWEVPAHQLAQQILQSIIT